VYIAQILSNFNESHLDNKQKKGHIPQVFNFISSSVKKLIFILFDKIISYYYYTMSHVRVVIVCGSCSAMLGTRVVLKSTLRSIRATKHVCACCGRVNVRVEVQEIPVETHVMSSCIEAPFMPPRMETPFMPPRIEASFISQHDVDLMHLLALQRFLGH
jgi:hypothetical protein